MLCHCRKLWYYYQRNEGKIPLDQSSFLSQDRAPPERRIQLKYDEEKRRRRRSLFVRIFFKRKFSAFKRESAATVTATATAVPPRVHWLCNSDTKKDLGKWKTESLILVSKVRQVRRGPNNAHWIYGCGSGGVECALLINLIALVG